MHGPEAEQLSEQLSAMTGINQTHIQQFISGQLRPDETHLARLTAAAKSLNLELDFLKHSVIIPDHQDMILVPKGVTPPGASHVRCQSVEILSGDLIPLVHTSSRGLSPSGQYWMQVESVQHDDESVRISFRGGTEMVVPANQVAHVVRKLKSS